MEIGTIAAILIAVIAAIILIYYLSASSHPSSKGATTYTGALSTVAGTTSIPAVVQFYDINLQYDFSGAEIQNGVNCTYTSYAYIDGSQNQIVNGSETFYLHYQISSTMCPMTITGIGINTTGFSLVSTVPTLPLTIPKNSQAQLQLQLKAPNVNFYGPLSVVIYYT